MARTRSGPLGKLNAVTDEYEKAQKLQGREDGDLYRLAVLDSSTEDDADLDAPTIPKKGMGSRKRSELPQETINDVKKARASRNLRKAESEE